MKYSKLIVLFFSACLILVSCSDKGGGSSVGADENTITYKDADTSLVYNIQDYKVIYGGDTTTLVFNALDDSLKTALKITFYKIVNLSNTSYEVITSINDTSGVRATYRDESNVEHEFSAGTVEVAKYQKGSVLQARYKFVTYETDLINGIDTLECEGEINLNMVLFDPDRIPNIDIKPASMTFRVNDTLRSYNSVATHISGNGIDKYVINGTWQNQTLVIEMSDIELKMNKEYPIGQLIESVGFIKANYSSDRNTTYWADGRKGTSGKIKIYKIVENNTLQGYFEFVGVIPADTSKKARITQGKFYTKLKRIE
ncbi:MAG TPA: hypothetical protein PK252_08215 [Bacteroidales bacterium]|nr:hypothetical protein [Bacteroidales bacterium]